MFNSQPIPEGPWQNPELQDEMYDAIIHEIRRRDYGKDGSYFQIVIWLCQPHAWIVTNIYVREKTMQSASQRVWHLCQACGVTGGHFYARLHEFSGKHLLVSVRKISTSQSGAERCFSDVHRFWKPTGPPSMTHWQAYEKAVGFHENTVAPADVAGIPF